MLQLTALILAIWFRQYSSYWNQNIYALPIHHQLLSWHARLCLCLSCPPNSKRSIMPHTIHQVQLSVFMFVYISSPQVWSSWKIEKGISTLNHILGYYTIQPNFFQFCSFDARITNRKIAGGEEKLTETERNWLLHFGFLMKKRAWKFDEWVVEKMESPAPTGNYERSNTFKVDTWFSQFRNGSNPWMARYVYGFMFLLANLLAWAVRDYGNSVLIEMNSTWRSVIRSSLLMNAWIVNDRCLTLAWLGLQG